MRILEYKFTGGFVDKTYAGSGRHLSEENHLQRLNALALGYMTNSDLEKAIKAFHGRCGHISRTYRVVMNANKTRLSVGLFSMPKVGSIVKPPKE
ncbi:Peptidase M14, carboxypeptidase A [Artemisia annua]|uniref:Peptidase M14, carboxypeptidase A n=1 Tax=Artemisia annua TaxID=35608 RepID=A0A2U1MVE3_ARTAN|nr:Peptidase M14, carboxypeptidase A [Artemisia annua]